MILMQYNLNLSIHSTTGKKQITQRTIDDLIQKSLRLKLNGFIRVGSRKCYIFIF